MKNKLQLSVLLAIVFQLLVLCGMQIQAALPLWMGTEVKINTVPVDPRSLFRGNYAKLSYDMSQVNECDVINQNGKKFRVGELIFTTLKLNLEGLYEVDSISLEQPKSGIYLTGRVARRYYSSTPRPRIGSKQITKHCTGKHNFIIDITYGIEAFFAKKESALDLEHNLRDGGVAVLMVSSGGRARIKEILK